MIGTIEQGGIGIVDLESKASVTIMADFCPEFNPQ